MQKYLRLSNIIPESIALLIVLTTAHRELSNIYLLLVIYSLLLRFIWQSAIIVHGLGHTTTIAISDRQLSFFNFTNILEHQTIATILKSLLPCQQIFIPKPSPYLPISPSPYLPKGKLTSIRLKALGGILFNLAIAIIFTGYSHNFLTQAVIVANLLIAVTSLSDIEAMITGVADCFYCGNFGLIALRKPNDSKDLLPPRMVEIAQQMGQETEVRGEQAGGGLVIAKNSDYLVFVGKKIVNQKRCNLTQSLEAKFAAARNKAIAFPYDRLTEQPLIYASMGTLQNQLLWIFEAIAEACQDLDVQLVIALGGGTTPESLPKLLAKAIVVGYAPQLELLPKAALTITHAGMNTTLESLSYGVPMVAIPITNDRPGVAARIAWTGTGEVVPLKQVNVAKLHQAIQQVLTDKSYKENALKLQKANERGGGVHQAADIIEQAVTRKPVLTTTQQ